MAYGSPRGNKKRSALGGLFTDPTRPKPKKTKAQIEEKIRIDITNRLRKKLGAQFTEKEAQRVINQALRARR
jgi:hypothetical protein